MSDTRRFLSGRWKGCFWGIALLLLCALSFGGIFWQRRGAKEAGAPNPAKMQEGQLFAGASADVWETVWDEGLLPDDLDFSNLTPEDRALSVYTFLQGPRSFSEGRPWSGEWCRQIVQGNSFGGFGCGLCCMANIYSTLTEYECSPWDMFGLSTAVSQYYPSEESGAIGWEDLKRTLRVVGFGCELYRKPKSYKTFQRHMRQMKSAIVLISSSNDDAFWQDTPGHYVNIWLYQEDEDMVFLADPGDPDKNRSWIPLRYVYDALKTVSQFQYLSVTSYSEEGNEWQRDAIEDAWNGKY